MPKIHHLRSECRTIVKIMVTVEGPFMKSVHEATLPVPLSPTITQRAAD